MCLNLCIPLYSSPKYELSLCPFCNWGLKPEREESRLELTGFLSYLCPFRKHCPLQGWVRTSPEGSPTVFCLILWVEKGSSQVWPKQITMKLNTWSSSVNPANTGKKGALQNRQSQFQSIFHQLGKGRHGSHWVGRKYCLHTLTRSLLDVAAASVEDTSALTHSVAALPTQIWATEWTSAAEGRKGL